MDNSIPKKELTYKKIQGNNKKKVILVKGEQKDGTKDFSHLVPPPDQIELKGDDLKEEFPRILTISKQLEPIKTISYNYKDKKWIKIEKSDQSHIYLNFVGNYYFKDSEDAKIYSMKKDEINAIRRTFYDPRIIDDYFDENNSRKFRILKNKFNYSDRLIQTYNKPLKEVECQTDPPQVLNFSDGFTQFSMFKIYEEDFEKIQASKQKKKVLNRAKAIAIKLSEPKQKTQLAILQEQKAQEIARINKSALIIERMISQNLFDEIIVDYKYFDDVADNFRSEGTLLPLWKFTNNLTSRKCITAICWSKYYTDFFIVATGSYKFFKKTPGSIICFSLKNPSHYEYKIETSTGCMSLDINPKVPYLIAAGFYDGTVSVYDLRLYDKQDLAFCIKSDTKHYDPVWQVQWQPASIEGFENFNSISSDGKVYNWELRKSYLLATELSLLQVPEIDIEIKNATEFKNVTQAGTCMDFNNQQEDLFIVGTEDGKVLEYSAYHKNKLLTVFDAHSQAIYSIKWNTFFKRVFITCSADFTVKIWDHRYKNALLSYELSSPVTDVQWAPYSSTVFAAITSDGYIHIFDIYLDLENPLCVQNVMVKKRRKLTHICFSPFFPILIVGDEKGTLASFKISPNLRSIQKDQSSVNTISILNKEQFEQDKIRNILSQEAELNPELVETNRKAYKFERVITKKQKDNQDDDEQEEKGAPTSQKKK